MTAYVMAHVQINDPEGFEKYTSVFGPTMTPFGGKVLVAEDDIDVLEGDWPPGRTVMLEFETREQAQAWFDSDAYQEISEFRRAATVSTLAIFDSFSR